ncbi:MAG TPA: amidohydrolase family protein [Terriglobales bacterium]|nr:amidohydrolase family protein [Terriglobales bacterium]
MLRHAVLGLVLAVFLPAARAQVPAGVDPGIWDAVRSIRAIDDHAHPPALPVNGVADTNYDALPCPPGDPTQPTLVSRPDNPAFLAAAKALFGYPYTDRSPAHLKELAAATQRLQRQQGSNYRNWVLDRLGIETELANRVAMGPGLAPPRFRWVAFDDALLLPFDDRELAAGSPDRAWFYPREDRLLAGDLRSLGLAHRPGTLETYIAQVVLPTLARQQRQGAVAIKFEAAHLRPLNFAPPQARAAALYARFAAGGAPNPDEAYAIEDAIFHAVAVEAGKLGLAVHFHTGFGCGAYFDLAGSNPMLLLGVFNDPSLRHTNFVLLHGGNGPFTRIAGVLAAKPNVYLDTSGLTWLVTTAELARVLRYWLELYPDKVLFGTDASPGSLPADWEEMGWQTSQSVRTALAAALTGMMRSGEIARPQAEAMAHAVLHDNAARLYGWNRQ